MLEFGWRGLIVCVALGVASLAGGCGEDPSADANGDGGIVVPGAEAGVPVLDGGAADSAVPSTFTVGIVVTGLVTGGGANAVVLQNNGGDDINATTNGSFVFRTKLAGGAPFNVTVKTQPTAPPQTCIVSGGSGFVVASNVTSVTVNCQTNRYTVGGTIAGIAGTAVLTNNDGDNLAVSAVGKFAFATTLESGAAYDVKVATQPGVPSQACAVTAGTGAGTVGLANVATVEIVCTTNKFTVGGSVTGLNGGTVVLQNKGGDNLPVSANEPFTFVTAVASGATYDVTVLSAPAGMTCDVTNGTGTMGAAPKTNVAVACVLNMPNCTGFAATCGPASAGDCCESSVVPTGTFSRSYDAVTPGYTNASFVATVSDFRLDTYEATVSRFRAFMASYPGNKPAAGAGKNPNDATDPGWDVAWNMTKLPATRALLVTSLKSCGAGATWTDAVGVASDESRAISCVAWHEAFAFCIWDGGRLPTEAEWNYAAAGGSEQRAYPWSVPSTSKTIDATYAAYGNVAVYETVGSRPNGNGRWGQADLAGNVWEWTLDWARTPYAAGTCNDCANFIASTMHVVRGGGINNTAAQVLSSNRGVAPLPAANPRAFDIGVRCARTP